MITPGQDKNMEKLKKKAAPTEIRTQDLSLTRRALLPTEPQELYIRENLTTIILADGYRLPVTPNEYVILADWC